MDDDAGASSDVLAGEILDVSFERVLVRTALRDVGRHCRGELTVTVEHRLGAANIFGSEAAFAVAGEDKTCVGEVLVDRRRSRTQSRSGTVPCHLALAHCRPKQVLGGYRSAERCASDSRTPGEHGIDSEVWSSIRRDEKGAVHVRDALKIKIPVTIAVRLARLVLPLRGDSIIPE